MITGKKVKKALKGEFSRSKLRVRLTTGEMLAILREKNELTQNQLAQKAGLTQATISSLESNRISLGVQDFDENVQRAINRIQSEEQTGEVVRAARAHGVRSINIDLILKRLLEKGRIVYKRAYCDWAQYRGDVREFHARGIELVDLEAEEVDLAGPARHAGKLSVGVLALPLVAQEARSLEQRDHPARFVLERREQPLGVAEPLPGFHGRAVPAAVHA